MTKYIVTAEPRAQAEAVAQIQFVIEQPGYKQAWVEGRNLCRLGGPAVGADGTEFEIGAGTHTVRKVFTLDKPSKKAVVTVDDLVAAAEAEGLTLNQRVRDLISRLKGDEPAAEEAA